MKKFALLFALGIALVFPLRAQQPAPANPYDLLSRALTPIATIFSPEAQLHALNATLVLEEMTGLPPEMTGMRVELALQPPDRVLIRFPYQNEPVTFCRDGQSVWITPNQPPFDALAALPGESKKKKPQKLGPMVLPFPPQQLVLLPVLFQVKEAGGEQGMRKIEAALMPELARGLGVEEWSVQLTLDANGKPARIRVVGPGWHLAVRVETLDYARQLPEATWEPTGEAIRLNARQIRTGLDSLGSVLESQRPASPEERSK
jgi:hypothetical protein